jgi:hypothetical protein
MLSILVLNFSLEASMKRRMKPWLLAASLAAVLVPTAHAAQKADPTGNWEWTLETPDGQQLEFKANFKLEGDKLTGGVSRKPDGTESKLEQAKFKDGEISFQLTREFDGNKIMPKYSGKLSGDEIKGKIEVEAGGQTYSFDWKAKRVKDKK